MPTIGPVKGLILEPAEALGAPRCAPGAPLVRPWCAPGAPLVRYSAHLVRLGCAPAAPWGAPGAPLVRTRCARCAMVRTWCATRAPWRAPCTPLVRHGAHPGRTSGAMARTWGALGVPWCTTAAGRPRREILTLPEHVVFARAGSARPAPPHVAKSPPPGNVRFCARGKFLLGTSKIICPGVRVSR